MYHWVFNFSLKFIIFCFEFDVDNLLETCLLKPLLKIWEEFINMLLVWCFIKLGYQGDEVSEVRGTSSFPMVFYEKMFGVSIRYLVSSERHSASNLILTRSLCCQSKISCCLSNLSNIYWIVSSKGVYIFSISFLGFCIALNYLDRHSLIEYSCNLQIFYF